MDVTTKYTKVVPVPVFAEIPETYTVSPEQYKFYWNNGYLVIKELIDFATLYSCKQRFTQYAKGLLKPGNSTIVREPELSKKGLTGEDAINKIQDILFDDVFVTYTENPRLLHVVSQFIGDNLTAMHSMFINKPPGTGRHPTHQDLYYFPFRPADKIIAAWTAVDHVTFDNGCMYVIPGSHKHGLIFPHINSDDPKALYHGVVNEDTIAPKGERVHLEMSPGDTLFMHSLLLHGSEANVTQRYRKSVSCHYANSECEYVDVYNSVQDHLARSVEKLAKNRGFDISFIDAWRYRSKLVKGVKCNL